MKNLIANKSYKKNGHYERINIIRKLISLKKISIRVIKFHNHKTLMLGKLKIDRFVFFYYPVTNHLHSV